MTRLPEDPTPASQSPKHKAEGSDKLSPRAELGYEIFLFICAMAGLVKVFVTSWSTVAKGVFTLGLIGALGGIIWLLHQWNDDHPNPVGKATVTAAVLLAAGAAIVTGEVVFQSLDQQSVTISDPDVSGRPAPERRRVAAPCVSHQLAEAMIGMALRRIANERCGFLSPITAEPLPATCPRSWVCVWDESSRVTLRRGDGQTAAVRRAASRYVPAYPRHDPVRDVCEFLLVVREDDPQAQYIPEPGQPPCF